LARLGNPDATRFEPRRYAALRIAATATAAPSHRRDRLLSVTVNHARPAASVRPTYEVGTPAGA